MEAVLKERQLSPSQEEELELREVAPEKFGPEFDAEFQFKLNQRAADTKKQETYRHYTREEVNALIAASKAPVEKPPVLERTSEYSTYTREQVQVLLRDYFSYKSKPKEDKDWDSQKTTELEQKIKAQTKRTKSTKA